MSIAQQKQTVRAKFQVIGVSHVGGTQQVTAIPVYSPDPEHENKKFWDATPSGRLELYIQNPAAFGTFQQGREYYLDFTPADQ
ncbi:MAG: hypothetical protein M3P51_02420 [Chloroflexota bacterium]|nr:hypothetical protein [Chloroflexota bacterium]